MGNGELVLSVRGEAAESVDPDLAVLGLQLVVTADSKAEASIEAGSRLDRILADLAALGGVARTARTDAPGPDRPGLTWSTTSVGSRPETGKQGPTGRALASVDVSIRVRDLSLLDALQAVLDGHDELLLHHVSWQVDRTNPAWRSVRSAAIGDSVRRARDYAQALGGAITRIEHLADTGLLAGNEAAARRVMALSSAGGAVGGPHLDPVPQTVTAVVEARFVASGVTLPEEPREPG